MFSTIRFGRVAVSTLATTPEKLSRTQVIHVHDVSLKAPDSACETKVTLLT
jgi:hypothetical protein